MNIQQEFKIRVNKIKRSQFTNNHLSIFLMISKNNKSFIYNSTTRAALLVTSISG